MISSMYLLTMTIRQVKGRNLRRLRERFGLKQWQIGEMINAKESNISAMEKGRRTISDRVIDILCERLKVQPWEFLITDETPIVRDQRESQHIEDYREAEKLLIADKVDSYMSFIIKEKRREKKEGNEDEEISKAD